MTFDKEQYWKRRNEQTPLRGQGDRKRPIVIPQGTPVTLTDRSGKQKPLPNDLGSHMTRINRKLVYVNRKVARGKVVDRSFTKHGADHNEPAEKIETANVYPINVKTNHERHKWREMVRSRNDAA